MKDNSSLSLGTNISWNVLGTAVYTFSQWAMLAVLTKVGTLEMVGQFALGLAVTAPVVNFLKLQLRWVQATDVRVHYNFGDYLALRLIAMTLALLAISGIT